MSKINSDGSAFGRATLELINTISELERCFSKAEELTENSKEKYVARDIQTYHHDSSLALGLALWRELDDFYKQGLKEDRK